MGSVVRRTSLTSDRALATSLPKLALLVHLGILGHLAGNLSKN